MDAYLMDAVRPGSRLDDGHLGVAAEHGKIGDGRLAGPVDDGPVHPVPVLGQREFARRLGPRRPAGYDRMVRRLDLALLEEDGQRPVRLLVAGEQEDAARIPVQAMDRP